MSLIDSDHMHYDVILSYGKHCREQRQTAFLRVPGSRPDAVVSQNWHRLLHQRHYKCTPRPSTPQVLGTRNNRNY